MDVDVVYGRTTRWIADVVIGLNLCPFARRPFENGLIRYTMTTAKDVGELRELLSRELRSLADTPPGEVETAFVIHPYVLNAFRDYNDFVAGTEDLIAEMGLEGVIQIAGFHPQYQFAGTKPDDVENYTNRSPYPMLHLLREASITRVNDDPDKVAGIPERNIATMRRLGREKILEMLRKVDRGD